MLKLNGFTLSPDASAYLTIVLGNAVTSDVVKQFVDYILSIPTGLVGNRITKAVCEKIIAEWQTDSSASENAIYLVNALDVSLWKPCTIALYVC